MIYMYICEIQTAKFALLWYCVCFMYMCPYSILEHIYAQGFSVGNYCMWTWGAFNAKNLNNAMICEKCFSFRSSIYMYMFKKKILVSISIIFKGFLFYFAFCVLFMQFTTAFSHSESVGWRYVISASALYTFWSKTTIQIILYGIVVELIVIFFSTVSRYLILFHDMW